MGSHRVVCNILELTACSVASKQVELIFVMIRDEFVVSSDWWKVSFKINKILASTQARVWLHQSAPQC